MSQDSQETEQLIANRLEDLVHKRGQMKATLTRFITFLGKYTDDRVANLEARLQVIQHILHEFDTVQSQIELIDPGELNSNERENFEDKYYDSVGIAKNLIKNYYDKKAVATNIVQGQSQNLNITGSVSSSGSSNLLNKAFPPLELIKFYGDYDKWDQFRDLYVTLVHNDNNIDKIRKFYYLLGSLRGEAAKVLESIQVTSDNYSIAWDLLIERYDNKAFAIKNHIRSLFNLPTVSKDKCSLRSLLDEFQKRYRALELLKEPVSSWDTLLIYLITSKLDSRTATLWEELIIGRKITHPSLKELLDFLNDRSKLLETTEYQSKLENKSFSKTDTQTKQRAGNSGERFNKQVQGYASTQFNNFTVKCVFCKESHVLYRCGKFAALPVASRLSEIKRLQVCANCFRTNHATNECSAQGCKVCSGKHNTMLHVDSNKRDETIISENQSSTVETQSKSSGLVVNHSSLIEPEILLSTAVILIQDRDENWHRCRALLDSGSMSNFMTQSLAEKLNLSHTKINIPVIGVGTVSTNINNRTCTTIKSINNRYENNLDFLILEKITEKLPTVKFDKNKLNIPANTKLADINFNSPQQIDILLGASIFYDILCPEQIKLGENLPILQSTVFGYIVSGPLLISSSKQIVCNFSSNLNNIDDQLEKFWILEECPSKKYYTAEEAQCEKLFIETVKRDETGHFVVTLPIRDNAEKIGSSIDSAVKRLHSIERKFTKNLEFKNQYIDFMREYISLGHMSKIDSNEANDTGNHIFYLPHHGVLNESSTTTALRVVFDGSCPSSTGVSLNDTLMTGPCIQDDLLSILIRFRKHNIVLTADVAKMYRQVNISENQKNLQRIVWRENPEDEISHFTLNTVTYGTSPASFLATRALQQAAIEYREKYPESSEVIMQDFYVDDLISGARTLKEAIQLKSEIDEILSCYGFNLRKWVSNDIEVIGKTKFESADKYYIYENEIKKTLGLFWDAKMDVLKYSIQNLESSEAKVTKRFILSSISKIFDPLGLISPVIIRVKILLQKLWQCSLDWDDYVPTNISNEWFNFSKELPEINKLSINRHVLSSNPNYIELHCFCDASQDAYGACIYVRSVNSDNTVCVNLLCGKSRVSPLKTISIPRLELCGALLATQLCEKVQNALKLNINQIFYWTDSTVVLSWLSLSPSMLKIFVANRIAEIQEKSNVSQWRHVSTTENPADLVSRGVRPSELQKNKLWWFGPAWLSCDDQLWPESKVNLSEIPERKSPKIILTTVVNKDLDIFNKYSSFYRLQRVIALCFRFYYNCKLKKGNKRVGELTVEEIEASTNTLLKIAQLEMFPNELYAIENNKPLSKKSKLISFNPLIDGNGLLRVGGRLNKSDLSYNQKHQILLASKHPLTRLIVLNEHHRRLHSGIVSLLSSLREKYWVIHGRRAIRSILKSCLTCFKAKPIKIIRQMGELPPDRVNKNRPFYITGVDFAGPFHIKDGKIRNRAIIKSYLCIFICFTTKAVHLESVGDLRAESFLNALKRFVSRRGLCKVIYSDNGTNFTGANQELKRMCNDIPNLVKNSEIANFLLKNSIKWNFIPPRSPHHGGLWECAVKRAKYHITRVIGKNILTFEEISTLFAQVEAAMNSSPITPLSEDPSDLSVLTPGHFLIGEPLLSIPQTDLTNLPSNRLNQFQSLQQMYQLFWKRWSHDYLINLQQRSKWRTKEEDSLRLGSMVLLIDENLPPLCWRMGRIIKLHPGEDQIPRVATVKISSGETTRAVQKLCLLPIETDQS